jgi:nucleotide-binding universal stress UspA family protein
MPYKNVVVIYEASPAGDELLEAACRIVKAQRAQLTILHINLLPLSQSLCPYAPGGDPVLDAQVQKAEKLAGKWGVRAVSAVRCARVFGVAVVNEIRTRGADLLALLSPDAEGLPEGRCLSADIEMVIRKITCALLLYRPARQRKATGGRR